MCLWLVGLIMIVIGLDEDIKHLSGGDCNTPNLISDEILNMIDI